MHQINKLLLIQLIVIKSIQFNKINKMLGSRILVCLIFNFLMNRNLKQMKMLKVKKNQQKIIIKNNLNQMKLMIIMIKKIKNKEMNHQLK